MMVSARVGKGEVLHFLLLKDCMSYDDGAFFTVTVISIRVQLEYGDTSGVLGCYPSEVFQPFEPCFINYGVQKIAPTDLLGLLGIALLSLVRFLLTIMRIV